MGQALLGPLGPCVGWALVGRRGPFGFQWALVGAALCGPSSSVASSSQPLLSQNIPLPSVAAMVEPLLLAVVIGNSQYATAPLRNPPNDARDMSARLHELGFEVLGRSEGEVGPILDATSDDIDSLVDMMCDRIVSDRQVTCYSFMMSS